MRALLGTLGGSGVFTVLAAGGMWTAIAVAAIVVAVVLVAYRLVRWILDSDYRTRRARELLHAGRGGQGPPAAQNRLCGPAMAPAGAAGPETHRPPTAFPLVEGGVAGVGFEPT